MTENIELFDMIVQSTYFKTGVGTVTTALIGWIILFLKNTNKKINNAATKDELDRAKNEAFKYTERHIQIHEDKQKIELFAMNSKITETHEMVQFIYQNEMKRNKR